MIKTEKLTKKFNGFTALSDVTCNIPQGCIYGMVGSNGAGKSTFLRLLTGVYKPDAGNIRIDESDVWDNPAIKRNIAYVPDTLYFIHGASMTGMAAFYNSIYKNFDYDIFNNLTKIFGLDPKKPIGTFSKGMQRQAAIIFALSSKPDYMFFDETFDGLDPVMRNLVKSLICNEVLEHNVTAIITSHSLRELEDICDQLSLLHKGGLILENDIGNLKTSRLKIQIAFNYDYDKNIFPDIEIHNFKKSGSVTNMIVSGSRGDIVDYLKAMKPILLEVLPLTLEEVFTYEMETLGYSFDDIIA